MFHFSYIVDNPNMAKETISILLITLNNTERTGKINLRAKQTLMQEKIFKAENSVR